VVLGIIVLLATILMPAVSRAREESRRIACLSNIRQLTSAWTSYATDNKGHFCNAETQGAPPDNDPNKWLFADANFYNTFRLAGYPAAPNWFWSWIAGGSGRVRVQQGKLWPYVRMADVYRCPGDLFDHANSYQINGMLAGEVGTPKTMLTISQIPRPAGTFVFIESFESHGWLINSFQTPIYPKVGFGSTPGINHMTRVGGAAGCTVAFADGHAIFWEYADQRTSQIIAFGGRNVINSPLGGFKGSADVAQLEGWSGGPVPPGVTP